jgi:16S rRNA (cytosine1402-N4)-methyltransferase
MTDKHVPVLLQETIDSLDLYPGEIFVDGTVGSGGHSSAVARMFGDSVQIIGLDRDMGAISRSQKKLSEVSKNFLLENESFKNLDQVLNKIGVDKVDAILLDLGISSNQLEESGRGFTFQKDEPLLMTMSESSKEGELTASIILNTWDEDTLELILRGFGEEKSSKRIARAIVEKRESKPFQTTFDLVNIIQGAVGGAKFGKINPSTKTFQALRIAVNEELSALTLGLQKSFESLKSGGRLSVISFHSLEDRIVKNYFRELSDTNLARLINKKPIVASDEETESNPRSRSAKLRIIQKYDL